MDKRARVVAVWFAALFTLAIGVQVGTGDQLGYLLDGLNRADPGFLAADWYTRETSHVHSAYSWIVLLAARSSALETVLALGAFGLSLAFAGALYWIVKALYERPLVPWATTLMLFAAMGTRGPGLTFILWPLFLASTASAVAMTVGLACRAWNRDLMAGTAMGLGALLHAHFAVLFVPVMLAVSIADRRRGWRPALAFWAPFLLLAAPTLLQVIRYAAAPSEGTFEIAMARLPHHLDPSTWSVGPLAIFLGALALGAGGWVLCRPMRNRPLEVAVAAMGTIVVLSIPVGYTHAVEVVNRLWPWRLAPFVICLTLAVGSAGLIEVERKLQRRNGETLCALSALLFGAALLTRYLESRVWLAALAAWMLPASAYFTHIAEARFPRRWATVALPCLLLSLGFVPLVWSGLKDSRLTIQPQRADRAELYDWVSEHTDADAICVIPPSWPDFRLVARRAIVVDWKSYPSQPADQIEWARRLRSVTGLDHTPGYDELGPAYATLDCDRALRLSQRYGARYVVLQGDHRLSCGRLVYRDTDYAVVDLQTET
jgi:hypothetical protein